MKILRPLVMGILNLTPDSFSDGGCYGSVTAAVERGLEMVQEGADIIDIGGESTQPEASRVNASEQLRRVLETIERLRERLPQDFPISIDTTLSEVAFQAINSGATMINDISAGRDDQEMLAVAASAGVLLVLMHMQGSPETMQRAPLYQDVVAEVMGFLQERVDVALEAGVKRENLILDPGIGFGKGREHNLQLLGSLQRMVEMGYPLLLGVSRKRFMGSICEIERPAQLLPATCASTTLGVMAGVRIFRVHDVWQNRQAADVAWAIRSVSM
ncbi:MAG: dihydropteroate synthase [Candidatus Thiodiazotropha sp.]|nr:dihydropteroate synthase [Candidatus Thiodiazotropha sp.]MCM8883325.1 dihydropteroate synthase [Candidatus Thiodiazotropha sp.]MCM8921149.1 dihydropteroate synthase [Candidatus Thiodiazotropha sp.]MCU7840485.1 dihydropteroate synthase [Candidatus Thiodiazotropha sp. (ex Troendleina suluensis)]MCU7945309.1 dihydropteroate synthase [Candidatus Thiodiazotropha sp. (ex Cardiolucina cf. quadrata)]